jgi:hypothetical protein
MLTSSHRIEWAQMWANQVVAHGFVRYGIHEDETVADVTFTAPLTPGEYLVTNRVSLDYHYIFGIHSYRLEDACARVVVFSPKMKSLKLLVPLLNDEWFSRLKVLFLMAQRKPSNNEPWHPKAHWCILPEELVVEIFMTALIGTILEEGGVCLL